MSFHLSRNDIESYHKEGYVFPVDVFSASEVAHLRQLFEAFESEHGAQAKALRTDLHLLYRWAWNAVTDARIVDPVTSLLGPNVLLWSVNWFVKEPGDGGYVSLHQDASYWGLEPHDVLTAWVALSDAGPATGPMRFLPGSHTGELYEHENTHAPDNLLTRGQTVRADISDSQCKLAPLEAGQMSLHHVRLVHGSDPNESDDRRIGMALRFCAPHVRQLNGPDTAVLVAGEDRYGHFDLLAQPCVDGGEEETRIHQESVRKLVAAIMQD